MPSLFYLYHLDINSCIINRSRVDPDPADQSVASALSLHCVTADNSTLRIAYSFISVL